MEKWPFADPPNVAVFTVRAVIDDAPILLVCHDIDDGGWQFLTGGPVLMAEALLVCLKNIVHIDPSVKELADLPVGWQATRERIGSQWNRTPIRDGAS